MGTQVIFRNGKSRTTNIFGSECQSLLTSSIKSKKQKRINGKNVGEKSRNRRTGRTEMYVMKEKVWGNLGKLVPSHSRYKNQQF